jgi:hypothetical protein
MKHGVQSFLLIAVFQVTLSTTLAEEEGFVSLFDGQTLEGWTINCLPKDKDTGNTTWASKV